MRWRRRMLRRQREAKATLWTRTIRQWQKTSLEKLNRDTLKLFRLLELTRPTGLR